jgi:hypothetical protein
MNAYPVYDRFIFEKAALYLEQQLVLVLILRARPKDAFHTKIGQSLERWFELLIGR